MVQPYPDFCPWSFTFYSSLRLVTIGHNTHNLRFRDKLSIYLGLTAHTLGSLAKAQRSHFENQGVAGNDWPAKARVIYTTEEHKLLLAVLNLAKRKDCATLGQGFNDEYAGHYRCAGKVALKKGLIDCHLFDSDDLLKRNKLDYSINEQKWVSMWQVLLYRTSV